MMMKSTIRTLFLLSALLVFGLRKRQIRFHRTVHPVRDAGQPPRRKAGNTHGHLLLRQYQLRGAGAIPAAEQNSATIRLRKGVYTFIVEADATYSTGEKKILRCTDYNQIPAAMTWVEDSESIVLLLKSI